VLPGRGDGAVDPDAAAISGYAVVTCMRGDPGHERRLDGEFDRAGQQALDTYQNDQRAALLWYHDTGWGSRASTSNAGLAGLWSCATRATLS